jgi:hypothetical protein
MAKKANIIKDKGKVTFGKRRIGKHSKTTNKHSSSKKKYVGQGR